MYFADKIRKLRKEAGLSQEELAEALNVSRQAVSRWEKGSVVPDANNLLQISDLFDVTVDYLIKDEYESDSSSLAATRPKTVIKEKESIFSLCAKAILLSFAVTVLVAIVFFAVTAELTALLIPALTVSLPALFLSIFNQKRISLKSVLLMTLPFLLIVNTVNLVGFRLSYQMHFGSNTLHLILWDHFICFSNTAALISLGLFVPFLAVPRKWWVNILIYLIVSASICGIICSLYRIVSEKSPSLIITWLIGCLFCFMGCAALYLQKGRNAERKNEKM